MADQNRVEFLLPKLHDDQLRVRNAPGKYKVCVFGRRWGKSTLAMAECSVRALKYQYPVWWVAPTFRNTKAAWRTLLKLTRPLLGVSGFKISKSDFMVTFPGGGFVQVVSGEEPDNLRSEGLGFIVYDECAFGQVEVWTDVLLPAMMDYNADAMLISTPNGLNWFYEVFNLGLEGKAGYASYTGSSYQNPHLNPDVIDARKLVMTEARFRQEIMAEFIDSSLGVFRGLDDQIMKLVTELPPVEGHEYVLGIDWGRVVDYTVLSMWDATLRQEVAIRRFNSPDWEIHKEEIVKLCQLYHPYHINAEENAAGSPVIQELANQYNLPIFPIFHLNQTKKAEVENLQLAIEKQVAWFLDNDIANKEMRIFQQTRTPTGLIKYAAPPGSHDDCVIARMLAWDAIGMEIGDIQMIDFMTESAHSFERMVQQSTSKEDWHLRAVQEELEMLYGKRKN